MRVGGCVETVKGIIQYCSLGFRDWKICVRFMEEVERIAEFLDERKEVYIYI